MIRISRIVAKDRIADLLDLNFVSKITLRQGFKKSCNLQSGNLSPSR